MFVIMNKLLNGLECMLLNQVVQSFWGRLFDMIMLRRHIPASNMPPNNASFTLPTDAVMYNNDDNYHRKITTVLNKFPKWFFCHITML